MKRITLIIMAMIFTVGLVITSPYTAAAAGAKKQIRLSAIYVDPPTKNAIKKYEKMHPDIDIKIVDTMQNLNDPTCYEKFVKTVNTEIMAGQGADIQTMDYMNYVKYADKGLLADLNSYISKDKSFNIKDYNQSVINAYRYKSGIYAVPLSVSFPVLIVDQNALKKAGINLNDKTWTWNDFYSIAQKVTLDKNKDGVPEQYAFENMQTEDVMKLVLNNSYSKFIDMKNKKANFNSKEFIALLNTAKQLKSKKLMNPNAYVGMMCGSSKNTKPIQFFNNKSVFQFTAIANFAKLGDNYTFISFPRQYSSGKVPFEGYMVEAISSNSKYKAECWDFLKYLLSEEQQNNMFNLPVNLKALEKSSKEYLTYTLGHNTLNKNDINKVMNYYKSLSEPNSQSYDITTLIDNEAAKFIDGKISAEAVANTIQNKITILLNE